MEHQRANKHFAIKKKKIEVNSVGKEAMGRERWKSREGIKGSQMSVKKRFIQTQICV